MYKPSAFLITAAALTSIFSFFFGGYYKERERAYWFWLTIVAYGKELTSEDEKIESFKRFWAQRDPSPGTDRNELMDEYYNRVAYANENYTGFRDGWKTDMGMIYIIFGSPSDIERHPFEQNYKPYEVWYYYHINRMFIFVDETGFGEYRLSVPYDWRDWQGGIYY